MASSYFSVSYASVALRKRARASGVGSNDPVVVPVRVTFGSAVLPSLATLPCWDSAATLIRFPDDARDLIFFGGLLGGGSGAGAVSSGWLTTAETTVGAVGAAIRTALISLILPGSTSTSLLHGR